MQRRSEMELITSCGNEKIKNLIRLNASSKERREQGLFVLEGARLCFDAAKSGASVESLFYTAEAGEKYASYLEEIRSKTAKIYEISGDVSRRLSETRSPQGVFCVCRVPENSAEELNEKGCYAVLERVQDPSNLGAIARTAEALGISGLIVSGGCDIYNPKAQRAAMGSLLRLPIIQTENLPEFILSCREKGMKAYASTPASDAEDIRYTEPSAGEMWLIGNEGAGISEEAAAACDKRVTIPMAGRAESLNASAAAAIILWEAVRGR